MLLKHLEIFKNTREVREAGAEGWTLLFVSCDYFFLMWGSRTNNFGGFSTALVIGEIVKLSMIED